MVAGKVGMTDDPVHLAGEGPAVNEAALVLAAGKGTRMRSSLPKVLHRLAGTTMLARVLRALNGIGFARPTIIVGYGAELVRQEAGESARFVVQDRQLGTGHAVRIGMDSLPGDVQRVLVVNGDEPLLPPETLRQMLDLQQQTGARVVLLTTHLADTRGFGRVIRNQGGEPVALMQEVDLSAEQQAIDEVNLGAYVFDAPFLRVCLAQLQPHPPKGEYYVTDVVAMAAEDTERPGTAAVTVSGGAEVLGINDLVQLEEATQALYRRTNYRLMASGVTIVNSASTFIGEEVEIEADTVIEPGTTITGQTRIGRDCVIGPHAYLVGAQVGEGCRIVASTVEDSTLEDGVAVGPYSHVRGGSHLGRGASIGNFAEINRSAVGPRYKMHHFSYVGDAVVGSEVNIGAGTVTCNFDGRTKHRTTIEDGAFIGSDTMLRAPVTIGKGASTGAGSVVTRDVSPGSTVAGVPARVMKNGPTPTPDSDEQLRREG